MNNEQLKEKILAMFPKAEFVDTKGQLTVTVPSSKILSFAKDLKESPDTCFDYLISLSGVDYTKTMAVFYHVTSSKFNHTITIKTILPSRDNAATDSVFGVWKSAEFHEREAWDLLGITFKNHPDLRRMFLEETWVGHPLRKDYSDPINIVER